MQAVSFYAHALSRCEKRRREMLGPWFIHTTNQQMISEENLKGKKVQGRLYGPRLAFVLDVIPEFRLRPLPADLKW